MTATRDNHEWPDDRARWKQSLPTKIATAGVDEGRYGRDEARHGAYPSTDNIAMKLRQTIKLRFIGTNQQLLAPDACPWRALRNRRGCGEGKRPFAGRYGRCGSRPGLRRVIWTARKPGRSLVYCHIPHHTANNNVEQNGGGGLMLVLNVT